MYSFSVGSLRLRADAAVRLVRARVELARAVNKTFIVFGDARLMFFLVFETSLPGLFGFTDSGNKMITCVEHGLIYASPDSDDAAIYLTVDVEHIDHFSIDAAHDPLSCILTRSHLQSACSSSVELEADTIHVWIVGGGKGVVRDDVAGRNEGCFAHEAFSLWCFNFESKLLGF